MNKLKYVTLFLVMVSLAGITIIELTAESIKVGNYSGNVGDIVLVNVTVNGTDINGLSFNLVFNNSKLYVLNVTEGDFMRNACNSTTFNVIPPEINNTLGVITFYNFCWGHTLNGSGVIATITFNITASGTSDLTFQNVTVFDESGNQTNESVVAGNGSLSVHECDLNHDGIVTHDYSDLMTAYRCFLGIEKNCGTIRFQDWQTMKKEYGCVVGD